MRLRSLLTASVILLFSYDVASYDVPTNFGCKNSMITDEWRTHVLNFHNKKRRDLALGKVRTMNNKMAPMAGNINELLWDCNIETYANKLMCGGTADPNYFGITQTFKNSEDCNVTVQTDKILKEWWSQSTAIDLTASQKYTADAETKAPNFSHMAAALATAFACTYGTCTGATGLKFNCVYNKVLTAPNDPIYEKVDTQGEVCTKCDPKLAVNPCIDYLCQQDYISPGDIPARACTAQDEMSNDLQTIATDMHNYYRRLVATGWGKDKDGYAPPAKNMLALSYACDTQANNNIATATKTLVDICPNTPPTATAGHSLNHFFLNSYSDPREVVLKKAIEKWANEAAKVGVGKDNIYHPDKGIDNYAHMMQNSASEVTCAVKVCDNTGTSAAICQYNAIPTDGDPIYEMGKRPCSPCPSGKTCEKLGGLCA